MKKNFIIFNLDNSIIFYSHIVCNAKQPTTNSASKFRTYCNFNKLSTHQKSTNANCKINYNFRIYSVGIVGPDAIRGFTAALYVQQPLAEITRRDYETRSWLLPNDWYIARVSYKIFFNAELN